MKQILEEKCEAWLIFGVNNKKEIIGTNYRKQGNLQELKRNITQGTNERLTFLEIYTLNISKKE